MVDKWGRPGFDDWMGMANAFSKLNTMGIDKELKEADLDTYNRTLESHNKGEEFSWGLQQDPGYMPEEATLKNGETNPDFKYGKEWQTAKLNKINYDEKKMAGDTARWIGTQKQMAENLTKQLPILAMAKENGDGEQYNRTYESLLKDNFDIVKTDTDYVRFDWVKDQVLVRNNITGDEEWEPIPKEADVMKVLNNFYDINGTEVGINKDKTKNLLTFSMGSEKQLSEANNAAIQAAPKLIGSDGDEYSMVPLINYRKGTQTTRDMTLINRRTGNTYTNPEQIKEISRKLNLKTTGDVVKDLTLDKAKVDLQRSREGIASDRVVTEGRKLELQEKYVKQFGDEATRAINSILPTGISYKDGAIVKNIGGKDMAISEGDITNSQVKQVREVIQESNYFASLIREGKSVKEAKKAVADAREKAKKARAKVKGEPGAGVKETVVEQSEFEKEVAKKVGKAQPPVPVGGGVLDMSSVTPKGAMDAEKMRMNLSEAATEEKKKRGWIK